MKKCNKCKEEKELSDFSNYKRGKDGLQSKCKQCVKEYSQANKEHIKEYAKEHYQANKERINARANEYYQANKEHRKQCVKKYSQANKERRKQYAKEHYQANKERRKQYANEYYHVNKERINARANEYIKARLKTDSLYRLKHNLRSAVKRYITGTKNKRAEEILGMSFKDLKERLVGYDNTMHLDHIIPQSWALNEQEVYILNHYSNFQLLTAEENIMKGDRFAKFENVRKVFKEHNNKKELAKIILRNSHKLI